MVMGQKRTVNRMVKCISVDDLRAATTKRNKIWNTITDASGRGLDEIIDSLPSAQSEIKPIEYRNCANAMLKMWMDNVVTDWEYNRIMDKLNAHWGMRNG